MSPSPAILTGEGGSVAGDGGTASSSPVALSDLDSELIVAMENHSQYVSLLLASRFAMNVEIDLTLLVLGDHTPLHCVFVNKMK